MGERGSECGDGGVFLCCTPEASMALTCHARALVCVRPFKGLVYLLHPSSFMTADLAKTLRSSAPSWCAGVGWEVFLNAASIV